MTPPILIFACLLPLAACSGASGQVPVSGISGDRGGATATIYYDAQGDAHFRN